MENMILLQEMVSRQGFATRRASKEMVFIFQAIWDHISFTDAPSFAPKYCDFEGSIYPYDAKNSQYSKVSEIKIKERKTN